MKAGTRVRTKDGKIEGVVDYVQGGMVMINVEGYEKPWTYCEGELEPITSAPEQSGREAMAELVSEQPNSDREFIDRAMIALCVNGNAVDAKHRVIEIFEARNQLLTELNIKG